MASWLSRNLNWAYFPSFRHLSGKATCVKRSISAATKHQLHVLDSKGDLGVFQLYKFANNRHVQKNTTPNCGSEDELFFVSPTEEVSTKAKCESRMKKIDQIVKMMMGYSSA